MRPINKPRYSEIRDDSHASRTVRFLVLMGAVLTICSAGSSFAQIDRTQFTERESAKPQVVSKNQLLAPPQALRAIERAQKAIVEGHFESAQNEIARALNIAPHFGTARALQGGIYLQNENYDAAAKSFQEALDDDPALGAGYTGMAVILIRQNRVQAALPFLDRAESLLPSAWYVRFAESWTNLKLGNIDAALKQTEIAERIARDSKQRSGASYLRALLAIHVSNSDSAKKYLAETIARDPGGQFAALAKKRLEQPQLVAVSR